AGLHVVETVDARDAVADRQHLADLGDLGLLAEVLDLILEDRRDLCGADFHNLPLPLQRLPLRVGDDRQPVASRAARGQPPIGRAGLDQPLPLSTTFKLRSLVRSEESNMRLPIL